MAETATARIFSRQEEAIVQNQTERVNILVVDDLPEKILIYQTILEELDQNLIVARSGEEALHLILKHEFAVILLDVNMPGMDGFEVASIIRARKKSAHTPIIFLTAFSDDVQVAQGYASGAVDYLPTPVIPEVLKAKVKVFIELSQMRQQAAIQAEERARRTAAEEADRRKDEFMGMLAHELRNPLGPIRNAIHLFHMIGPHDPRWTQLRDMIDRQVSHMTNLIDDLLDSTRLSRGQILLRKGPCDLTRIVEQTAEDYKAGFEASGLSIEIDVPKETLWVEGDPTRLVQSIGNLLHNAHKFTNPGGSVKVTLRNDRKARMAIITVQDTGIGIAPDLLPHIFEVFRQADQGLDRNRGGLGLGLSLVKGLIELHNGKVSVHSKGPGHGSTFTLQLPLRAKVAPSVASICDTEILMPGANECRILVIEDNTDTAESVGWLLGFDGYDVKVVHGGSEGLEIAQSFQPKVILCDIGLPGMDGYQVVRTLRDNPDLKDIYTIALTGYGREEDLKKAHEAGFDLHLTKPVDYNSLRRVLAHIPQ